MIEKSKSVYVIGATGLIGSKAVTFLVENGYRPVVLSRNIAKAKSILSDRVNALYWNGIDVDELVLLINGSRAIINLAGESIASRWTSKKKSAILRSRVDTTTAIVEAIRQCAEPPEVYIHGSAIGYYPFNSNLSFDEDGLRGDGFLSQVVSQWEQAAVRAENKTRLVIIRTGVVLSSSGGFLGKIAMSVKLFSGGWFGNGNQMLSWIHIKDHVSAIKFLLENSTCSGVFNLTSEEPITIRSFVKRLGAILNRPAWLPVPAFVLRLMFGKMADEVILSNQNIIPKRLIQNGFKFEFSCIDDALHDLLAEK